jgi:hypothetical protein
MAASEMLGRPPRQQQTFLRPLSIVALPLSVAIAGLLAGEPLLLWISAGLASGYSLSGST